MAAQAKCLITKIHHSENSHVIEHDKTAVVEPETMVKTGNKPVSIKHSQHRTITIPANQTRFCGQVGVLEGMDQEITRALRE